MLTKNNWLTTNLPDRYQNPEVDFTLTITPYPFKKMEFNSAVEMTIKEISSKYSNFYLGFSGGYDSEFVLRAFHKFGIPIIPIIVHYGTDVENKFAYKACADLGITPVVITPTDEQFLKYLDEKLFKKFNGPGYHATHVMFAAEYVEQHNGTLITGGHWIGADPTNIADDYASSHEWDYYTYYEYPAVNKIDFFLYTIELMYSMFPETDEGNWSVYKQQLFNIEYREKVRAVYSPDVIAKMRKILGKKEDYKHRQIYEWTREEFNNIFDDYVIKNT
jgi:7-cyano-7-deazaguanine synthase in queuosine biosynthesis